MIKRWIYLIVWVVGWSVFSACNTNNSSSHNTDLRQEKYRPQYHFSPKEGWIGDPDGLVFYKGLYHLFWWGHAVSKDLVHWKQLPYPMLGGDSSFIYFSGSVVVDKHNTAEFGDSAMIAIYTMHMEKTGIEKQAISYSTDGIHFHFYEKNPIIDIDSKSFRDPQVFWYEPDKKWVMIIALPGQYKVRFYASQNLKDWKYLSEFGPMGAHDELWEVPDLFKLSVDNNKENQKWVLSIGQGPNKMQYFLGSFDGKSFTPDSQTIAQNKKANPALWSDYGSDFYAARSWRGLNRKDGKDVWLGWLGNWEYANHVPTQWGRGFESIPREISLKTFPEGVRLVQLPIEALRKLRIDSFSLSKFSIVGEKEIKKIAAYDNTYELFTSFLINDTTKSVGLNLLIGDSRSLIVSYHPKEKKLILDRSNCSDYRKDSVFNKYFPKVLEAPLSLEDKKLSLHIFVDKSSVEIFAANGKITMSATTFPSESQTKVSLFSKGKNNKVLNFKVWKLASIWK